MMIIELFKRDHSFIPIVQTTEFGWLMYLGSFYHCSFHRLFCASLGCTSLKSDGRILSMRKVFGLGGCVGDVWSDLCAVQMQRHSGKRRAVPEYVSANDHRIYLDSGWLCGNCHRTCIGIGGRSCPRYCSLGICTRCIPCSQVLTPCIWSHKDRSPRPQLHRVPTTYGAEDTPPKLNYQMFR